MIKPNARCREPVEILGLGFRMSITAQRVGPTLLPLLGVNVITGSVASYVNDTGPAANGEPA